MELPEQIPGAEASQFRLLGTRRFLPFFLTQFFGAFNDNVFRNALVVSVTFGAAAAANAGMVANLAQALFILPFFLFSALAGQIADKYEKSLLIRQTRLAEVVLMFGAAAALYAGHVPTLLTLIFLLGILATIFGPLKYSLMPQHLRQSELVGGTAGAQGMPVGDGPAVPSLPRSVRDRGRAHLDVDREGLGALAELVQPRRAVAARTPQAAALPAGVRIVDAPVEALSEKA